MYLATKPSKPLTTSETVRWYAAMISRRSSGSSRVDNAVEPTISQNITDSCRRSASVRVAAETDIGAAKPACPIGLPQPPQNLAAGSFSKPQAGHCEGSGDPHSAQKRRIPAFSAMQLGQRIQSLGLATRSAVRTPRGRSRQKRRFNARRDQSRPLRKVENPGHLRQTGPTPQAKAPQERQKP